MIKDKNYYVKSYRTVNGREVEMKDGDFVRLLMMNGLSRDEKIDELHSLIRKTNNMISNLYLEIDGWMDELKDLMEDDD